MGVQVFFTTTKIVRMLLGKSFFSVLDMISKKKKKLLCGTFVGHMARLTGLKTENG